MIFPDELEDWQLWEAELLDYAAGIIFRLFSGDGNLEDIEAERAFSAFPVDHWW